MKRLSIVLLVVASIGIAPALSIAADNFPTRGLNEPQQGNAPSVVRQNMHAYIPPAPIRHTWPGGYKVIFHELTNTLAEHILGHY